MGSDDDVTDLTSRKSASQEQASVQKEPGAHTMTDLYQHHVARSPAKTVLGQHRGARVVPDDHRDAEARGESVLELLIAPAEVRCAEHDSSEVDHSR